MKKQLAKGIITLVFIITATGVWAQPGGGGGGQGNGGPPPSTSGPIDGGASMLLAAVSGYAYLKKRKAVNIPGKLVDRMVE
jgi:hypothetical protein